MRYVYLDGLRGIAILGVLATHIGQVVSGLPIALGHNLIWGMRGVHLFFIVSSLTLFLVTKPESLTPSKFFVRRFFRIAPMFYLAALSYSYAAHMGWLTPRGGPPSSASVAITLLFLHGFNPYGINNVVPGGWSIACEVIFYGLFVIFVSRIQTIQSALACVAIALSMTAASLAVTQILRAPNTNANLLDFFHFNFFFNSIPFSLGALVYTILKDHRNNSHLRQFAAYGQWIIGFAALTYGAIAQNSMILEIPFAFLLASYTLLVAISPPSFIVSRPMQFIGEISFSLYLVHFAVISVVNSIYPRSDNIYFDLIIIAGSTLIGSAAIATLFHRFIEVPMISLGRKWTAKTKYLQPAKTQGAGTNP